MFARYTVKMEEMRAERRRSASRRSTRISPTGVYDCGDFRYVPPPKDRVYTEMEALIQHFLLYSQGFNVPKGECYVPVEGPRGEHGFYIVSDGGNRPMRVKSRAPSFFACQALPQDDRRRPDRRRDRGDRIDGRRDGRRGPMTRSPSERAFAELGAPREGGGPTRV